MICIVCLGDLERSKRNAGSVAVESVDHAVT